MIKEDLNTFIKLANKLVDAENHTPVVEPISPKGVTQKLNLELSSEGISEEEFYQLLEDVMLNTPRTATNRFFNQLFGGRKGKATLGDLLAVMLNTSMYTYKVAGPMVGIEKAVISQTAELIGYEANQAGGTIAPGGSMSNYMAMVMARDKVDKDSKNHGIGVKMLVYTSADCHYSIAKNSALIGVGRNQVRFIPTDQHGRMLVEELEKQINIDVNNGHLPFFVNATAGTTVLGAFDPIEEMSSICKKHNLWLHVDGAYCGSVIFSEAYKHLVNGAHLADSFSLNAHKMLGTPLTCSLILSKEKSHLYDSFSNEAEYLYQTDEDDFNLGKTSLQCGRRNDALKFWALWKSIGTRGLEALIDQQFLLADFARDYIKKNQDYTLYSFNDSISICFNYKEIPPQKLCTLLYEKAELMVGFGQFKGQEFIRLVTINSNNTEKEILEFFRVLEDFVAANRGELQIPAGATKA
ncbi:MAG: cysteine synthase [Verrucomicrobia bacterium]|nr:cysteine synthase [Verrucomicrobiota bacterium]